MHRLVRPALLLIACAIIPLLTAAPAMADPVAPATVTIARTTPSDGAQFPINWSRPAGDRTGYSWVLDQSPTTEPDLVVDTTDEVVILQDIAVGTWYAHVRTIDGVTGSATVHSVASVRTGNPAVTITSSSVVASPALTAATSATFTFTYANADRTTCALDHGAEVPCASPYTVTGMAEGPHSMEIRARGEGQRNALATYSWFADPTAPTLTLTPAMKFSTTTLPEVGMHVFDSRGVASAVCTLDGRPLACDVHGGTLAPFFGRGTHVLAATVTDVAGNATSASVVLKRVLGPVNAPTDGKDRLVLTNYDEELSGLAGNDTILGMDGMDRLFGGAGNDVIDGGDSRNFLVGEAGNDRLVGGDEHNSLDGGPGNDVLIGGDDSNELKGQAGRDTFIGGPRMDTIVSFDKGKPEVVRCGVSDDDEVWADRNDKLIGCEIVHYGLPKRQTVTSLLYKGKNPGIVDED